MLKTKFTKIWDLFFGSKMRKYTGRHRPHGLRFEPLEERHMLTVVTSFTPTDTGFVAQFDQPIDPSTVVLSSGSGTSGGADMTLSGVNSGDIQGSVAFSSDMTQLTFVKNDGALAPDTYTASLFDSIHDAAGAALDGDADGAAGGTFTGTFLVGDTSLPAISVVSADFDAFRHTAHMQIALDAVHSTAVTVKYVTVDGTASSVDAAGVHKDYNHVEGTAVIPAGELTANLSIEIYGDDQYHDPRTFTLQLLNPSNGAVIAEGTGTIHDVKFSITPMREVPESAGSVTLMVTPSSPTYESSVWVEFQDRAGTAVPTSDYASVNGSIEWTVGDSGTKLITVPIVNDNIPEDTESFFVGLANPHYADEGETPAFLEISSSVGQVNILDDDADPSVMITSTASAAEGNEIAFTVSLSGASSKPITVDFATANDSAAAGTDFAALSGTLTFAPGETAKVIQVATLNDHVAAGNKDFLVNLSAPTYASLLSGSSTGMGTILDNPAPTASDDGYSVVHGQTLYVTAPAGVLVNDSDVNHAALSAVVMTAPSHGSLTLNADGSFSYNSDVSFTGTDSFTYVVNNGDDDSNVATVSINVTDTAPTAGNVAYNVQQNSTFTAGAGSLLQYGSDPEGDAIGVAQLQSPPQHGSVSLNGDGSFSYTAYAGYFGADSFVFTVADSAGVTASATANIYVYALPSLQNQSYEVNQDHTLTVAGAGVLVGATDANGCSISAIPGSGSSQYGGFYLLNADGSFTYTPPSGFVGTDTFSYLAANVFGSSTAIVSITVCAISAPTAENYSCSMTQYDSMSDDDLLEGVSDPNSYPFWVTVANGWTGNGWYNVNANGSFTYTPNGSFSGSDTFTFDVTNGWASVAQTVTINVQALPTPVAIGQSYGIQENGSLTGSLPEVGTGLSIVADSGWTANGWFSVGGDGVVRYTPATGYAGTDSFSYSVTNGHDIGTAVVSIIVVAIPAPLVQDHSYSMNQYDTLSGGGLLDGASDPSGFSYWVITGSGSTGNGAVNLNTNGTFSYAPYGNFSGTDSFSYTVTNGWASSTAIATINVQALPSPSATGQSFEFQENGSVTGILPGAGTGVWIAANSGWTGYGFFSIASDGRFSYVPAAGFAGQDSFTYSVTNGHDYSTAIVSITVDAFPAPLVQDHSYDMSQYDTLTGGELLDGTSDPNGFSYWVVAGSGSTGHGSVVINSDGTFTYTPDDDFSGADSFTFIVSNGFASTEATATITVQALPTPIAIDQTFEMQENGSLTGILPGAGPGLWVEIASGFTGSGSILMNSDGSFVYTPAGGFFGTVGFSYWVTNGHDGMFANVSITVNGIPAPLIQNQSYGMNQYDALSGSGLMDGASDPNGFSFSVISGSSSTGHGSVVINSDGTFSYTPDDDFSGTDSFTFIVSNGFASTEATATITVQAPPTPIAIDQTFEMQENGTLTGILPGAGTGLWIVTNSGWTGIGSFSIGSDGSISYTPTPGFAGTDSFTYTITNGHAYSTASVNITVDAIQAPSVQDQSYSMNQYDTLSGGGLLTGVSDPNGLAFWLVATSGPTPNGSVSIGSDGSFTYTPNGSFSGTDTFSFTVTNGWASSTATASILVLALPTPFAVDKFYDVAANTDVDWISPGAEMGLWIADAGNGISENGSYTIAEDGTFRYSPNAGFVGSDHFDYLVTNGHDTSLATVYLNVFAS
jgi:VCBS repeat-containing protein